MTCIGSKQEKRRKVDKSRNVKFIIELVQIPFLIVFPLNLCNIGALKVIYSFPKGEKKKQNRMKFLFVYTCDDETTVLC